MHRIFSQLRSWSPSSTWKSRILIGLAAVLIVFVWYGRAPVHRTESPHWGELHREPVKGMTSPNTPSRWGTPGEHGERESRFGWELFDHHTWVQGEHELQILEMRALKGQLELDLLTFDPIQEARITLDLGTSELGQQGLSKASVILTLTPHTGRNQVPIEAITQHISGAVPGLDPSRIAISDAQGYVYQTIGGRIPSTEVSAQDCFSNRITQLVRSLCGELSIVSVYGTHPWQCRIWIPSHIQEKVQRSLIRHIEHIATTEEHPIKIEVERLPSYSPDTGSPSFSIGAGPLLYGIIVIVTGGVLLSWLWHRWTQRSKQHSEAPPAVDLQVLAASLKGEDPKTLAGMISYLETERAEEILAAFPETLQNAILKELEKRG